MRASNRCFFFSSYSSACDFSLACCFFSISVRRFCAVEDELWDKVSSKAPNNLCPRLRSSNCPFLRRSGTRSCVGIGSLLVTIGECWVSRGLLALPTDVFDCLRLPCAEGWGPSVVSGSNTAEATALNLLISNVTLSYSCMTHSCASAIRNVLETAYC